MDVEGKRVLITGGSSGIGLELARGLAARGARLVIAACGAARVDEAVGALNASGAEAAGITADVATPIGRTAALQGAIEAFGGLDILVNNAGAVRAGRLDAIDEEEIRAMIEVDLVAPIMLTRTALPLLRAGSESMIVNVSSAIALVAMPFYATYAAVKAGLSSFGESLRRELNGEGVRVMTVYPSGTDTPMMATNQAGPEIGFSLEPAEAVAEAIIAGIKHDAINVVRGGPERQALIDLNSKDPMAIDAHFLAIKDVFERDVRSHCAL
ncbi:MULTISPECIES: SDR family oxidoreductase [unclassified Sphingobium]|nr:MULTISPECIES: SDR family oxidoreductase [unclassified Sphingobium]MBA4762672.1 SDR family oxidoreductase [Sphingomonas sp.]CAH0355392.1 3-phenylpropionate-dihydrodiol/cinnamic acid-dihydrodiol dehydrogenase [Sphingobium sp. CECT 9361]